LEKFKIVVLSLAMTLLEPAVAQPHSPFTAPMDMWTMDRALALSLSIVNLKGTLIVSVF
jgi:hypothetical protein